MPRYVRFLLIGLILGLFTEAQLKLVAGINPPAFVIAVIVYPFLLTLFYALSNWIDRRVASVWKGDLLHYVVVGIIGMAIEWTLLGNGPGSNAIQLGMFAMWTTFGFGPRLLIRLADRAEKSVRTFWIAFGVAAVPLTAMILMTADPKSKIVVAVLGLTLTYTVWSAWLLVLAWKNRHDDEWAAAT